MIYNICNCNCNTVKEPVTCKYVILCCLVLVFPSSEHSSTAQGFSIMYYFNESEIFCTMADDFNFFSGKDECEREKKARETVADNGGCRISPDCLKQVPAKPLMSSNPRNALIVAYCVCTTLILKRLGHCAKPK